METYNKEFLHLFEQIMNTLLTNDLAQNLQALCSFSYFIDE